MCSSGERSNDVLYLKVELLKPVQLRLAQAHFRFGRRGSYDLITHRRVLAAEPNCTRTLVYMSTTPSSPCWSTCCLFLVFIDRHTYSSVQAVQNEEYLGRLIRS
jgi:hypothetical protein